MRDVSQDFVEELSGAEIRPFLLFRGEFETGEVRLWTGIGTLTYDAEEYTGLGTLVSVTPLEETTDIRANGWSITLTGVPQENISLAIDETRQGASGRLYLGLMAEDGAVLDVSRLGMGKLDVPTISEEEDNATIQITYESDLRDLERPRETRYTNEAQQARFPGDKGFEHVAGLQQAEIVWGR